MVEWLVWSVRLWKWLLNRLEVGSRRGELPDDRGGFGRQTARARGTQAEMREALRNSWSSVRPPTAPSTAPSHCHMITND